MKIRCVGKAELGERSLEFCLSSRGAQMHSKDRLQDSKHQPTCQALLNWNSGGYSVIVGRAAGIVGAVAV